MRNLWTTKQTAEFLGVRPGTVYAWVKQRVIPFVLLNRGKRKDCVRFKPETIEAWIEKREQKLIGRS